jgi:hypothetical protein
MDGNSRPANSVHATSDSVAVLTIPNSGLMDRIHLTDERDDRCRGTDSTEGSGCYLIIRCRFRECPDWQTRSGPLSTIVNARLARGTGATLNFRSKDASAERLTERSGERSV